MQAGGVPIAVPSFCSQYVSENWKILFFIIIFSAPRTAGLTVSWSRLSVWSVSMLVYIDWASRVQSFAVGGSGGKFLSLSIRVAELSMNALVERP